jgi:hypothetical protein
VSAEVRLATTSIVVIGKFNPAVLHPYWFASRELLPPEQLAEARDTVQAVMSDVMMFEAGWLTFQAVPNRLSFTSKESASHLELRDLAIGTLSLLGDDPVTALGLNRDAHYRMGTEEEWHEVGDRFVPNEPWEELTGGQRAGLRQLVVQVTREGIEHTKEAVSEHGATYVTLAPSIEPQTQPYGLFVGINDHFQLGTETEPRSAGEVGETLAQEWEPARKRANSIAKHMIGEA